MVHTAQRLVDVHEIVERVRKILLVELASLRRLSLIAAVRAEVRAGAVRPRAVEASIRQLRIVRSEVYTERDAIGDGVFRVCRTEHAVDDLLARDRLGLEHRVDAELI